MFGGLLDKLLAVLAWLYILCGQPVPPRIKREKPDDQ